MAEVAVFLVQPVQECGRLSTSQLIDARYLGTNQRDHARELVGRHSGAPSKEPYRSKLPRSESLCDCWTRGAGRCRISARLNGATVDTLGGGLCPMILRLGGARSDACGATDPT